MPAHAMPAHAAPARTMPARVLAAALCLGPAGGCSSDVGPLREAYVQTGTGPKGMKPADFVADSRRAGDGFLPVGVSAPARPIRAKSSEGTRALEAELEGARGRNEIRGRAAESAGRATKPASATP